MGKLTFVSATRSTRAEFEAQSMLAPSLQMVAQMSPLRLCLFSENTRPLGACYNEVIDEAEPDDVLVFVHDDVTLDDWMCGWRVQEALLHFDVVGVAGNRRCQHRQVAWHLQPAAPGGSEDAAHLLRDEAHLSGAVMHTGLNGRGPNLTEFGPMPAPVALLDGVFLAARAGRLHEAGVRFDETLGFHFYDLDFCRSASAAGLTLGTWAIALTHRSGGASIHSDAWRRSRDLYFEKYGE